MSTPVSVTQIIQPSTPVRTTLQSYLQATGSGSYIAVSSYLKGLLSSSGNQNTTGYLSPSAHAYLRQELGYLESQGIVSFQGDSYKRLGEPAFGATKDGTGLPTSYQTLDTLNIMAKLH